MMSLGLFLALGALATGSAHAACPIGSYPRVDNWGTPVCKSFDSGQNTTRQGSLSQCPAGSHPSVNEGEVGSATSSIRTPVTTTRRRAVPQARIAGLMIRQQELQGLLNGSRAWDTSQLRTNASKDRTTDGRPVLN